jgi:creatinine amidohydrolase
MAKYRYEEHTWPELNEAAKAQKVVVIPVGTTEQHGHHLPLSVDCVTSGEMSRMAVERVPGAAILMPQIWYSFNEHHLDFPGTIAIQWQNIINYVVDVGKSVVHHGFRKILLVNGHGSNIPFLDISARLINNQTEANAALVSWWALAEPAITEIRESPFPGGMSHACELETSVLLHLRPDLVDMSKAVKDINFQPSRFIWWDLQRRSPVTFMEHFSRFSKTGVVGDATLGTAEKGKRLVECTVNNLVELIQEFRAREIPARVDHHLD